MPRDMEGTTQEERPGSGSTRQVAAETMRPHGQCLHRGSGKVHTAKAPADFIGVFEGHKVTVRGGSEGSMGLHSDRSGRRNEKAFLDLKTCPGGPWEWRVLPEPDTPHQDVNVLGH